jgi:hypothetical protein
MKQWCVEFKKSYDDDDKLHYSIQILGVDSKSLWLNSVPYVATVSADILFIFGGGFPGRPWHNW